MHQINRALAAAAGAGMLAATLAMPLASFAATTSTFTPVQSVANAAAGADTQTFATTTGTANVSQVKATRTLTVGALPANTETIVIGTCTVTFTTTAGSTVDDTNCAGGATIDTNLGAGNTNRTATEVAAVLVSLTGITDAAGPGGHAALTATASSTSPTSAVFTTTGTEVSATNITFTDGTTGDITSPAYATVTGVIPVAQVTRATPASVEIGDVFSVKINATTVSFTATAATVANVTAGLTTAINASAVASAVTAADQTTRIDITSDAAGTAFTTDVVTGTNLAAVAQVVVFTPGNFSAEDVFEIRINGTDYRGNGASVQEVVEELVDELSANTDVTCTEDDTAVTCTADVAGTAFTYAAFVLEDHGGSSGSGGGGSHHSSGGGSSSSSSSAAATATTGSVADLTAQVAKLQAMLATLMGTTDVGGAGTFGRDLDVGSEGPDVSALQTWLIAKGYSIAAGATGYFGAQTQAALAAYQAATGISPAVGFFGPKTRAVVGH